MSSAIKPQGLVAYPDGTYILSFYTSLILNNISLALAQLTFDLTVELVLISVVYREISAVFK